MENENQDIPKEENKPIKYSQSLAFALGELCFVLLPFVVMTILFAYKNKLGHIFSEPEWALASSVMFGQVIIKVIHITGNLPEGRLFLKYRIGTFVAFTILIGLVPSLTVLALLYTAETAPLWLINFQIVLFILAVLFFIAINYVLVDFEEEKEYKEKKQE